MLARLAGGCLAMPLLMAAASTGSLAPQTSWERVSTRRMHPEISWPQVVPTTLARARHLHGFFSG